MKRIVNGLTYNTATSTRLAEARWKRDEEERVIGTLYQTRGGAYFTDEETVRTVWNEDERRHEDQTEHRFVPLSAEGAQKWLVDGEGDVEIFHNPFEDPPEASAEADPGATIYVRVPASLKKQVDDAAKSDGISANLWAMSCVERCLATKINGRASDISSDKRNLSISLDKRDLGPRLLVHLRVRTGAGTQYTFPFTIDNQGDDAANDAEARREFRKLMGDVLESL